MNRTKLIIVAFVILSTTSLSCFATAQNFALGLYYPDFRAMRTIVDPKGQTTIPTGYRQAEIAKAWSSLTEGGRNLLMMEKDLAVVVIDSDGNWYYRTSGIYTLRPLTTSANVINQTDVANLEIILSNPWFNALRDFFSELLFARANSAAKLGELVSSVDNLDGAEVAQKNWFRSIVGSEIVKMDNVVRRGFLFDDTYGSTFTDAVAIAQTHRVKRLDIIVKALEGNMIEHVLPSQLSFVTSDNNSDFPKEYVNVVVVDGKKMFEVSSDTGTLFIAGNNAKAEKKLDHSVRNGRIPEFLQSGQATAFIATPGTDKVYQVISGQGT